LANLLRMRGRSVAIFIKGASIGYQIDDENWQLYHHPLNADSFKFIKAKAVRYGWEESEIVEVQHEVSCLIERWDFSIDQDLPLALK